MFLVGGGIINHAVPLIHHFTEDTVDHLELIPNFGSIVGALTPTLINLMIGIAAGLAVILVLTVFKKICSNSKQA